MGDDTSRSSSRNKFPSRKRLSMEETTRQEVLVSVNKKKTKKPFQKDVAPELESSHKNVLTEANSNTDQPPPLKKKNRRRKKPVHHENSLFEQMKISANNNKEVVSCQRSFQRILFGTNFNLLISYRLMRTLTKNFFTLSRLSLSQLKIVMN